MLVQNISNAEHPKCIYQDSKIFKLKVYAHIIPLESIHTPNNYFKNLITKLAFISQKKSEVTYRKLLEERDLNKNVTKQMASLQKLRVVTDEQ